MKLGTQIRMADGREGTVVYNSLIGVGIKWGLHDPTPADFEGTNGDTTVLIGDMPPAHVPDEWPWEPDALLRDPWPGCEPAWHAEQCVGEEYEIIRIGRAMP